MNLTELLSVLPFYHASIEIADTPIRKVVMDDRQVVQDSLFVCIKGFTVDGHAFAEQAVSKGAIAVIAEEDLPNIHVPVIRVKDTTRALAILANHFYGRPSEKFSLVGITGTNGKTTITYLIDHILQAANKSTGIIGTIQTKINDNVYPVKNTTPDALTLQATFSDMVKEKVDFVAMEVSSHALDLGRVNECDFDMAVYTNLSQDHLDYHENMTSYLQAKSLLFSRLGNATNKAAPKYAIINIDDPYSDQIIKSTAQHVLTYGLTRKANIYAEKIQYAIDGTSMEICTPVGNITVQTPLIGKFNVYNILASVGVAISSGIALQTIKQALETINGIDGRFENVSAHQDFAVIVDYAHTPDSLENVLQTIKQFVENKIYVLVGTGGDRDKTKRPLMAEIAVQYADHAIFTTDNPRTEDPKDIINDMISTLHVNNYEVIVDRKEAIETAIQNAQAGDVILIAGKGHETYQEVNGVRYDFDDRLIARQAIELKEQ